MSQLTESIQKRLEQLPQSQRLFYGELVDQSEGNIFTSIKQIRADTASGEIKPEFHEVAGLAIAALTEILNGEASPAALSEAEAVEDIRVKLQTAETHGDEQNAAILRDSLKKAEEPTSRKKTG